MPSFLIFRMANIRLSPAKTNLFLIIILIPNLPELLEFKAGQFLFQAKMA